MKSFFIVISLVLGSAEIADADPTIDDHFAARALQENCFNAFARVRQPGVGRGSAFFVHAERLDDGEYETFIVTAYHCVDDEDADIWIDTGNAESSHFEEAFSASLIAFNEDADIAVLRSSLPFRPATIALAPDSGPENLPCPVITIGCSHGEYPTIWSDKCTGTVADLSPADWEVATDVIHGRSGGPLICTDVTSESYGRVLGVCIRFGKNGGGVYSDLQATRTVLREAGLPVHVVNGTTGILPDSASLFLVVKLTIVVFLSSIVKLG